MPKALLFLPPLLVIAFDQITKALALKYFAAAPVTVLPIFRLVLVHNTGVSFGLFNNGGTAGLLILTVLSLVIVLFFSMWMVRAETKPLAVALGAVIGGALGNVIDRLRLGAVIDFLDFHLGDLHYPAFNIADSCIVLGIAFMLVDGLLFERRKGPWGPVASMGIYSKYKKYKQNQNASDHEKNI